ncbi:MAG TPA: bifunctional transaldolase/phosoglucose isomerase [Actinomycetota bacterium]|nr:bifunctional transaldolase/phosoglucose isomerase [Actinomycetota bacterium]
MRLHDAGQSVWLDYLRRSLIAGGGLERLVREDGISGMTSNPSIFGKAIGDSTDYDDAIRQIAEKDGRTPIEVFYDLALADVQMAADVFLPVYQQTSGADGFVSFELEPRLAHDTQGSIEAAADLFARIGKPNIMIKVPGTEEGVPAVEELTARGVSVNITLLFSVAMYEKVAEAYIRGLERRLDEGERLDRINSVASFFVSRVDTAVDDQLPAGSALRGKVAVANAQRAYHRFQQLFSGERWDRLAAAGARVQRPLWASTSTKNPEYSDVLYMEELVGPDTVNTVPEATLNAFRDHGVVRPRAVIDGYEVAESVLSLLPEHGIDLDAITHHLVEDGVQAFQTDLDKLLGVIERELANARSAEPAAPSELGPIAGAVEDRLASLEHDDVVARIWRKDHTVWRPDPSEISNRLGWLDVMAQMRPRMGDLRAFANEVRADYDTAVLLGMGGSSLAPEVIGRTLGVRDGFPDLQVLDTTHPETIARLDGSLDLARTLFIVSSKSGGTIETLSQFAHFFDAAGQNGDRFVAITDPGSPLEALANARGFRRVFLNPSDIGGRYSALSLVGLVPAALIGADLDELLESADGMASACNGSVPGTENPGAWLGAVLGEAARAGRDKLTLILPDQMASFGSWVEQLIAESTGKDGTGIVPVVDEPVGPPERYGSDRLFVAYGESNGLAELEAAGHPVVRLTARDLGAEFFRWEFATAVAGTVLGIQPFDQPNVEEAKRATKEVLDAGGGEQPTIDDLGGLLESLGDQDYVGLQAFVDPTQETGDALERARLAIRDRYKVAVTAGFGPRFLHSTGQLHKGGPSTGAFVQIVDASREEDVAIPGADYTFGELIDAQALGDLRALRARNRRVARVHLDQLSDVR